MQRQRNRRRARSSRRRRRSAPGGQLPAVGPDRRAPRGSGLRRSLPHDRAGRRRLGRHRGRPRDRYPTCSCRTDRALAPVLDTGSQATAAATHALLPAASALGPVKPGHDRADRERPARDLVVAAARETARPVATHLAAASRE
ncbi:hypothetical protein DK26_18140 [Bosea sp. WAO]|nr:hypothetical protein DK26_18140 [Bosea sp. WAO]